MLFETSVGVEGFNLPFSGCGLRWVAKRLGRDEIVDADACFAIAEAGGVVLGTGNLVVADVDHDMGDRAFTT